MKIDDIQKEIEYLKEEIAKNEEFLVENKRWELGTQMNIAHARFKLSNLKRELEIRLDERREVIESIVLRIQDYLKE